MTVRWEITERDNIITSKLYNENGLFHIKDYHKDSVRPFGKCAECKHSKFNTMNKTYDCPIVREYRMDRFRTNYDMDCDCYEKEEGDVLE